MSRALGPDVELLEPAGIGLDVGSLIGGAITSSMFLAITGIGVSLLIWRSPWWELVLGMALIPVATVGLGLAGVVIRTVMTTMVVHEPSAPEFPEPSEERIRTIPVAVRTVIDGVDSRDLAEFVLASVGAQDWTQARWQGYTMPSGKICDTRYHKQLVDVLVKNGIIAEYKRGSSGHLAVDDAQEALEILGLQLNQTN